MDQVTGIAVETAQADQVNTRAAPSARWRVARRIKLNAIEAELKRALAYVARALSGNGTSDLMALAMNVSDRVDLAADAVLCGIKLVKPQGKRVAGVGVDLSAKYAYRQRLAETVNKALYAASLETDGVRTMAELAAAEEDTIALSNAIASAKVVLDKLLAGVIADGHLHAVARVDRVGQHVPVLAVPKVKVVRVVKTRRRKAAKVA